MSDFLFTIRAARVTIGAALLMFSLCSSTALAIIPGSGPPPQNPPPNVPPGGGPGSGTSVPEAGSLGLILAGGGLAAAYTCWSRQQK
jgi:hypothetical protein